MEMYAPVMFCVLFCFLSHASHFRGGTISWKPLQNNTVEFKFKMAWTYDTGPGCTDKKIGQFVNNSFKGDRFWRCTTGCPRVRQPLGTAFYFCTGSYTIGTNEEQWEQGENTFQETFNGTGPFTMGYSGLMWMDLAFGQPNGWNVETTVDLRTRDDLNTPNSSPITASKPLYTLQFSCYHELQLPMFDPDGDTVKCRWAIGTECDSVCHAVPAADLDEDTCTLTLNASSGNGYVQDGWYAIALTVEDFPTKTIQIGNELYNQTTAMSTVPIQFLIHIVRKSSPCDWKPEFVSPTPDQGSTISIKARNTFNQKIYAANLQNKNESITNLILTRPAEMKLNGPAMDASRLGLYYWNISWTPTKADEGDHIICCQAIDSSGHSSIPRCFTLIAWDSPVDPCQSNPCSGQQQCVRIGSSQNIKCVCPAGQTLVGHVCQAITTASTTSTTMDTPGDTQTTLTPTTTMFTTTTTRPKKSSTTSTTTLSPTILPFKPSTSLRFLKTILRTIPSGSVASSGITTNKTQAGSSTIRIESVLPAKQFETVTNYTAFSIKGTKNEENVNKMAGSTGNGQFISKNHHKGTESSSNCFSSKPTVLLTTIFAAIIVALAAVSGVLTCMLCKMKKQLKGRN